MSKGRITLKDISQECGVSVNTVSRVFRDDPFISDQTKKMVREVASRLGYIRNRSAMTLSSGKSYTVALIVNDVRNPHFVKMLSLIDSELQKAGYDMVIFCAEYKEEIRRQKIELAISSSVDGIIYFPRYNDRELIAYIEKNHVPYVLLDGWVPGVDADAVCSDDVMGGFMAGEHMLRLGHRRFLYLGGLEIDSSQVERRIGFFKALEKYGMGQECVREVSWYDFDEAVESGRLASLVFPVDYTAVIAFNDEMGYLTGNALAEGGIRVPEDVSMIGFDHLHGFIPYVPRMTSIAAEYKNIGKIVVEYILRRIRNPKSERIVNKLPVQLFDEGTTMPPRICG